MKLHKNSIAICPIISEIGGITEKVSAFLDFFLQPVVCNTPSYLKNTGELPELLSTIPITHETILFTIDVKSMYLSIPQEEGAWACLDYLQQHGPLPLPKPSLNTPF